MPFTFSHAALVLPLHRLKVRLSLTGLIIGSLIPDLEYYIKLKKDLSQYGHTMGGVFWFDLPLALIFSFIFHKIIRNRLIHNSPDYVFRRFAAVTNFSWRGYFLSHYMIVILSILTGVFSHLLWDGALHYFFGNDNAEDVQFDLGNFDYETSSYRIVHLINSLIGLVIIFFFLHRMPTTRRFKKMPTSNFWLYNIIVTSIYLLLAWLFTSENDVEDWTVIFISCSSFALLTVTTFIFLLKQGQQRDK